MKRFAKKIVVAILGWQLRRLLRKTKVKVIAVAGSVGKTSTKFAISAVLKHRFRVQFQEGNYNDIVSIPLVFFGQTMPSLLNPLAWGLAFLKNEQTLRKNYPYDVVVIELGTDGPGQIQPFSRYLKVDIGVLTAIAPEHMEYFDDLDAVAKEELALASFSDQLIVNKDLCGEEYLKPVGNFTGYSIEREADYRLTNLSFKDRSYDFEIKRAGKDWLKTNHASIAETQLYSICAAAAVADQLGIPQDKIRLAIESIEPVSGRMKHLKGIKNSVILDDTYNASPWATKAALDTLYRLSGPQKIALLGNMNELGKYSKAAHQEIGEHCDPKQLDLVVTLGPDANEHLAPAAEKKGCVVKTTNSPYEAGNYIKAALKEGAIILAKGSQNGVFAEEAIKQILADPSDAQLLVRQSPAWLKLKQKAFKRAE